MLGMIISLLIGGVIGYGLMIKYEKKKKESE